MPVRVGYQGQISGSLDRGRQLALVSGFGPGDAAGNNLAGLRYIRFQDFHILVIDLFDPFSGKSAVLSSSIKS